MEVVRAREAERRELEKAARAAGARMTASTPRRSPPPAEALGGVRSSLANVGVVDAKALPDLADRVRGSSEATA